MSISVLRCLSLLLLVAQLQAQWSNQNSGFENGLKDWVVYKGPGLEQHALVEVKGKEGHFDSNHIFMRLPVQAKDNQSQYVKLGQYHQLSKGKRYRYRVELKWINPTNQLNSAIISAWTIDARKMFNGKDVWIKNESLQVIEFDFSPTVDGWVDCYLALLTHQEGFDDTDIVLDNFSIQELGDSTFEEDPRGESNLVLNGGFESGFENWNDMSNNPHALSGLKKALLDKDGNMVLQLELPSATNNTYLNHTSTGVSQMIKLYAGNTYKISADVERLVPGGEDYETIVNVFVYRPEKDNRGEAWLGSVDYKFNRSDLHRYSQEITASVTTDYMLVVRVFGWGNEGRSLKVQFDNIKLEKL